MKHVFKKSMMVAGVLACLFASTAFAQRVTTTPEQDKATQAAALRRTRTTMRPTAIKTNLLQS
jgi:hypothetical protein